MFIILWCMFICWRSFCKRSTDQRWKLLHHNHLNELAEYNIWLSFRPQSNNNNKIALEYTSRFWITCYHPHIQLECLFSFQKRYMPLFMLSSLSPSHSVSVIISVATSLSLGQSIPKFNIWFDLSNLLFAQMYIIN